MNMDFKKLASTLLDSDTLSGLSDLTGASGSEISGVLVQALPSLLNGANNQAKDKNTTAGFLNALNQHAKDDTKDISGFLSNIDLTDGGKIITHLLGSEKNDLIKNISKKTGLSQKKVLSILSSAAPLLMSLMGQQTNEEENSTSGIAGLIGSLVENVDVSSLLTDLLVDNSSSEKDNKKKETGKKPATTAKKKAAKTSDTGKKKTTATAKKKTAGTSTSSKKKTATKTSTAKKKPATQQEPQDLISGLINSLLK